jgi:hypothetical protein
VPGKEQALKKMIRNLVGNPFITGDASEESLNFIK